MFENYSKKQIEDNVKTIMLLEYLGIHIEDTKQIADEYGIFSKTVYYLSVPETSTIELDTATEEMSAKIKCADGLISLAKEEILDMLLDACKIGFGEDEEFIKEVKDNSSDYFKFYAKVRNGEVWNKELGDAAIKKLTEDIRKQVLIKRCKYMKNDIVTFIGGGIKCDNPECDYMDETVRVEEYKDWLNKPCPKCGSNLLTQKDYENVQMIIELANIINEDYVVNEETQNKLGDKQQTITFHMDGSGKMDVEINDAN